MRIRDDALNAACDAAVDLVDVGTGLPDVEVWSGDPPPTLDDTPSGTLLATIELESPEAFGDAGDGAADPGEAFLLGTPKTTTGEADGEIGFVRVRNRDGQVKWDDANIGPAASGAAVVVTATDVTLGLDVTLVSYRFRVVS